MRLRYTRTALRQIEDALTFLAARSPRAAAGMSERLRSVADLAREHPYAGQATSRPNTRRASLTPYPYVLFYRVDASEVVITRVRHAARRPAPKTGGI